MQAWKLLRLGALLLIGCHGSFATDTSTNDCRVLGCPTDETCRWVEGKKAYCEKSPPLVHEELVQEEEECPECEVEPCSPTLRLEVASKALLGGTLKLCATLQCAAALPPELHPRLSSIHAGDLQRGSDTRSLTWRPAETGPLHMCLEAQLPLNLGSGEAQVTLSAIVAQPQGHPWTEAQNMPLSLTHVECLPELEVEGEVTQPLAFVNGRLAFGAGNHLYVFEPSSCELGNNLQRLETGPVQGPMVVLGDTAHMAVATGLAQDKIPQLSMVDVTTATPVFAQNAGNCTATTAATSIPVSMHFNQGLSLQSLEDNSTNTPWRLAAPANNNLSLASEEQACLMAYTPWGTDAQRCNCSSMLSHSFLAPLAQRSNGHVVVVYNTGSNFFRIGWAFDTSSNLFHYAGDTSSIQQNPSFLAIADHASSADYVYTGSPSQSAAVVDNQNQRYEVFQDTNNNYRQLRRVLIPSPYTTTTSTYRIEEAPVGSPLLGEPPTSGPAEVYVVTSKGTVLAFHTDTLALLWEESLGFEVSQRAQPVLVPNAEGSGTLWVVGTQGEVRGLRVASRGLHRSAQWPKALRDNCNSSSRQVRYDETNLVQRRMRGCF